MWVYIANASIPVRIVPVEWLEIEDKLQRIEKCKGDEQSVKAGDGRCIRCSLGYGNRGVSWKGNSGRDSEA